MARILVTGCSSGIGRALVMELSQRGHDVVATARRAETLADLPVALALSLDVTDDASVAAAAQVAGDVDILINNAGFSIWGAVEAPAIADLERLFSTNVLGPIRMAKALLPGMRARGRGAIYNISSAAAKRSTGLLGHYAATKAALDAYTDALRIELAPLGIAACTVVLGAVESNFGDNRTDVSMDAYTLLEERARARIAASRKAPATAQQVASRIADAIDAGRPPLRLDGTGDGFALIAQRTGQDDESWEAGTLAGLFPEGLAARTG